MSRITGKNRFSGPKSRGLATVLILLSMFFNIIGTVAAAESWSGIHQSLKQAEGIIYVLCTPNGVKKIAFDKDGNPVKQDDSSSDNLCLFCLPFHKIDTALLSPDAPVQFIALPRNPTPVALHDKLLLPSFESSPSSPRAPPLYS
ncbi:DUF2946 family protein [Emcibacter sp.]|uniref:DUF2946 family protein n=1 Tax=Emcibacter sp. TaxID=1979954 RepID=UPI003A952A81